MKALGALLLLELLGQAWCCCPVPGDINIARGGEASQSSTRTFDNITGSAEKANDGVNDLHWFKGSCTHTDWNKDPWWRLDLKKRYKVTVVVVSARSDCCLDRMIGYEVRIGDAQDNNNPVCANVTSGFDIITTFWCNGMEGRYISVVLPRKNEALNICEVEVYSVTQEDDCW